MTSVGPETTLDSYPDGFSKKSRGGGRIGEPMRQRVGVKGELCAQKKRGRDEGRGRDRDTVEDMVGGETSV